MAIATATNDVDWPAIYASSSLAAENSAQAEILVQQGLCSGMQLHMTSMYAQPPLVQVSCGHVCWVCGRACVTYEPLGLGVFTACEAT
jgi:hypothetical protein